ncbi:hypothetical protein EB796_019581 [Bugula neritina]|uniref:Uncharacterized protein n=1 Tax=Bugula neritina TaxID=10212 RepID=A0A7J7J8R6_BUGNE|nr:hypothetical protein EB796_019581 [Bugula neritina]
MWRHEDKKPYKCTYCPFDGIQRSQIVAHMKSKHDVYPEDAKKLIKHISGRVASNIQTRPLHKDVGEEMELSPLIRRPCLYRLQVTPPLLALSTLMARKLPFLWNCILCYISKKSEFPILVYHKGVADRLAITQAAQGLAAGTNVQVAYGDYMINYMLEKAPEEEEAMDTQAYTAEQTE